jgi:hypothetical protein
VFETLAAVGIAAAFVLFIRILAGPGGDEMTLLRMFVSAPLPARPRGVQETDLAPFAFPDAEPMSAAADRIRTIEPRLDPARAA